MFDSSLITCLNLLTPCCCYHNCVSIFINIHLIIVEGTLPGALCKASDYWSFGVLLYELLAGMSLTSVHPEGITSHTILKTPEHLSSEAEHLLKQVCYTGCSIRYSILIIKHIKSLGWVTLTVRVHIHVTNTLIVRILL